MMDYVASEETQFQPGHRAGNVGKGRPSKLDDPDTLKQVAEAFATGCTRDDMCEMFGVTDPGTITRWRKDIRVKAEVRKIIDERILRISSKTDSVIEGRLQQAANEMSVDELIKIRKEFGGSALARRDVDADAATASAMEALEANPELLSQIELLIQGGVKLVPIEEGDEDLPDVLPDPTVHVGSIDETVG